MSQKERSLFKTGSFYPQMKAESQCYQEDDISNTLVVGTNPGFHNGIVTRRGGTVKDAIAIENHPNDSRVKYSKDNIVQALSGRMGTGGGNTPMVMEDNMDNQYVVRRLTPMECERLMGYPDNWSNIGEWTDSKGKKHKDADSPRYKALGNSLALPFWDWLAGRMCEHFDYQPTMASLFDGISGFPLVFERHGAKAIWASEVDEFAIAVAKRHFPEGGEENAETAENL